MVASSEFCILVNDSAIQCCKMINGIGRSLIRVVYATLRLTLDMKPAVDLTTISGRLLGSS